MPQMSKMSKMPLKYLKRLKYLRWPLKLVLRLCDGLWGDRSWYESNRDGMTLENIGGKKNRSYRKPSSTETVSWTGTCNS